jgi:predicted SAM-dependent methyltransferase
MLEGLTVVDLGCGPEKIVPWAVGVDDTSEPGLAGTFACDVRCGIGPRDRLDEALGNRRFDVLYSSHALEHIPDPVHVTVARWAKLLKPGGVMVLYLPDERFYVYDVSNPAARNPHHEHLLTMPSFLQQVALIPELRTVSCELDIGQIEGSKHLRYSFLWTGAIV